MSETKNGGEDLATALAEHEEQQPAEEAAAAQAPEAEAASAAEEPAAEAVAEAPVAAEEPAAEAPAEAPAAEAQAEEPAAEASPEASAAEEPAVEAAAAAEPAAPEEAPSPEDSEPVEKPAATAAAAEASPEASPEAPAAAEPQPAAATKEDFAAALAEHDQHQSAEEAAAERAKVGDKVSGRVVAVGEEFAFVALGGKSEGRVPVAELQDGEGKLKVSVGDSIQGQVAAVDEESGALVLRVKLGKGAAKADLSELRQAFEAGMPVEGKVYGFNKGGIEVKVAGMRGFCPLSQIDLRYVEDPVPFVGQTLSFKITRLDKDRRGRPNIVLSRRALLEEAAREKAQEAVEALEVGKVVEGTVRSLTKYGAFIDVGGVDGLLHVSEIEHGRVRHPKDVLAVGQQLEVQITKIEPRDDPENPFRISLSRRALQKDPWAEVVKKYPQGSLVKGKVVRMESFGAFVELEPGMDGLVHISALGVDHRVNHPKEVVEAGQEVEVTVLKVDPKSRRISLSMDPSAQEAVAASSLGEYQAEPGSAFGSLGDILKKAMEKS